MNIYVETYGCTANKSDESVLLGLLIQDHHTIVEKLESADVIILLTCTVIGTTEQRMLSRLKTFQKTDKRIIVTGCMSSVQPDLVKSVAPTAFILPPHYIQYITEIIRGKQPAFLEMKKTLLPKYFADMSAPIAIAEGCLLSCSYCITHLARGKLRSFPSHEIVSDIQNALTQGCKEIQITAQDTASYGLDIHKNLGQLLHQVCTIDKDFRVRIGMMNPTTLSTNLPSILEAYHHPKIYKFLHLPVQSGDNTILKKMNRKYSVSQFIELIDQFRESFPDVTLSTDIIVGFPTETSQQFHNTIKLLHLIQPDITNITRYSARPSTPAKTMNGRIPTNIVKERSRMLAEICTTISLKKNQKHIGNTYDVLITEKGKKNTIAGRSPTYKPVILSESIPLGKFVSAQIIDATPTHLVGKLI